MRAFATELAVNLRKESLEQMATAALQAKLAEMTVSRTAARPRTRTPEPFGLSCFRFGSGTTTQLRSLFQPFGCSVSLRKLSVPDGCVLCVARRV